MLLTKGITVENDRWKIRPKGNDEVEEILVIVESKQFACQKTMRFSVDVTFAEVLEQFIKKAKVQALPCYYGLYLDLNGLCSDLMEPEATLSSVPLPVPVCKPVFDEKVSKSATVGQIRIQSSKEACYVSF